MKDNEKIAELEEKIAELEERLRNLLEEYELIKAHQTHWKAECQLYEYLPPYLDATSERRKKTSSNYKNK